MVVMAVLSTHLPMISSLQRGVHILAEHHPGVSRPPKKTIPTYTGKLTRRGDFFQLSQIHVSLRKNTKNHMVFRALESSKISQIALPLDETQNQQIPEMADYVIEFRTR